MTRVPSLTSRQLVAALKKAGYQEKDQSGSHLILKHPDRPMVIVAIHARDVNRGTLIRIIRQAGFTEEEFCSLL